MRRVKIADFKNALSRHLRAVEQGAEIEVTDRHRPIVRLIPARTATGQVCIIPARRSFAELRDQRHRTMRQHIDSLRLLREERGQR